MRGTKMSEFKACYYLETVLIKSMKFYMWHSLWCSINKLESIVGTLRNQTACRQTVCTYNKWIIDRPETTKYIYTEDKRKEVENPHLDSFPLKIIWSFLSLMWNKCMWWEEVLGKWISLCLRSAEPSWGS